MNRIPVVNDEQRAGYGAPTTVVGAGLAPEVEAVYRAKYEAKDLGDKPAAKAKPAPKKKPAAKAKAKK